MTLHLDIRKMFTTLTPHIGEVIKSRQNGTYSYEAVIEALNGLQSNADYLRKTRNANLPRKTEREITINKMENFVERSGLKWQSINKLSVIHVTGTKGKGSTCAYAESILRHHGFRTGFYSSPHLIEVIERIKIDGSPVDRNVFGEAFWEIYNNLSRTRSEINGDMPMYFQMLTLVAFKIFMDENVDVAILEVGIGGEFDSTNVIKNTAIVGITPLALDHTALLGNTLDRIAWHKAGIMKQGCKAFTVPQPDEAMRILQERRIEKQCSLEVVHNLANGYLRDPKLPDHIYNLNASLAIALAKNWMASKGVNVQYSAEKMSQALKSSRWPGRYQIFHTDYVNYYLDGAHTEESLSYCINWFLEKIKHSTHKKALIFNNTGDRDSSKHLAILQICNFHKVFFVPNVATVAPIADCINFNIPESEQTIKSKLHKKLWLETSTYYEQDVLYLPTVHSALSNLLDGNKYDLLVTGSLHLVGALLSIIDPTLTGEKCVSLYEKNSEARKIS